MAGSWRRKWSWLLGLGAILIAAPIALLALVPKERVRAEIARQLAEATGQPTRLGGLQVRWVGGVTLTDLEIGDNTAPWLLLQRLSIDVNPWDLFNLRIEPTEINAEGLRLKVVRLADGTFPLAELLGSQPDPPSATAEQGGGDGESSLNLRRVMVSLKDAMVDVDDQPTKTRVELRQLRGTGVWTPERITVQKLRGVINDGPMELSGDLIRNVTPPRAEAKLRMEQVSLGVGMHPISYLVPIVHGVPGSIDSRLAMEIELNIPIGTTDEVRAGTNGRGAIELDPISLDGSQLFSELERMLPLKAQGRVASVASRFTIGSGRVNNEFITLKVGKFPLVFQGWTSFDGRLDYQVRADGIAQRLPSGARDALSVLPGRIDQLARLRVRGTFDQLKLEADSQVLDQLKKELNLGEEQREKLFDLGKKLLDGPGRKNGMLRR